MAKVEIGRAQADSGNLVASEENSLSGVEGGILKGIDQETEGYLKRRTDKMDHSHCTNEGEAKLGQDRNDLKWWLSERGSQSLRRVLNGLTDCRR